MDRRTYLAVGAAVIASLAGCAGDDGANGNGTSPTDTTSAGETPTDSGGPSDGTSFGDAITTESSFAFDGRYQLPDESGEATMEGRFADGNSYVAVTLDGETFEQYVVDDVSYLVSGGQCFENPPSNVEPADPGQDPRGWDEDVEQYRDVAPDGVTTVDGEEAYYWEFEENGEQITYYVSTASGRLLRVEFPNGQIDYHSWGSVDPISAPDMECTSL